MRGSANGNAHSPTGREMLTSSGRMVPLHILKAEDVHITDIAFGLGGFRFGNQHPERVTIAQHSVAVLMLVEAWFPRAQNSPLLRAALLHDAAEAYTQDLVGAVKLLLRNMERAYLAYENPAGAQPRHGFSSAFDRLGDNIQRAIDARFDARIPSWMQCVVHRADKEVCAYELALGGWHPDVVVSPFTRALLDGGLDGGPYEDWMRDGGVREFERCARRVGCG